MIRMNMINKLIMIIMPNNQDQVQAFINITITKETTAEHSKVTVEDRTVRNFTLKNNEIYDSKS